MIFQIGDLVRSRNGDGDIIVGGYMEQPPIPYKDWPNMFFEEGNEERGWFNENDFVQINDFKQIPIGLICNALGWQGGTLWQVIDEIKKIRFQRDELLKKSIAVVNALQ